MANIPATEAMLLTVLQGRFPENVCTCLFDELSPEEVLQAVPKGILSDDFYHWKLWYVRMGLDGPNTKRDWHIAVGEFLLEDNLLEEIECVFTRDE